MTIIAIDCDEVLMDTVAHLSLYVKKHFGFDWFYHDYKHYMLHENVHVKMDYEAANTLIQDYYQSPDAKDSLPFDGAQAAVNRLRDAGHQLYVVTARHEGQKALTYLQIDKYFPEVFDDIFFAHHYTDQHVSKSTLCKQVGATILIEDNIDYALEASEQGIKTFLLERPWNKRREETHPLMTKIKYWSEIEI